MDFHSKVKIGATSIVIALGCAGVSYLILKYRYRLRDAVNALNYLTIETVRTQDECDKIVNELRRRCVAHQAIGFDCEWVTENGKQRPVALMQLSSYDGFCVLFRLSQLKTIPKSLKDLLEDEKIYKVGVAPLDDAKYLMNDYSVHLQSTLDLRFIAQICGYNPGGLAGLSKSLLGIILDKSWRVRCSDWEADVLSERQIKYAAADAHVAIKLFATLIQQLDSKRWFWWWRSKPNVWVDAAKLCAMYADQKFKAKQGVSECKKGRKTKDRDSLVIPKKYTHATRSKPLYHNCFLEAPDGELLSTCDNKKALWYVEKQLADVVSEEPLTVRLRFEPAGRPGGGPGHYYQLIKENHCVVCASDRSYIRKNIVPREYRKFFPELMKDHSSHDVVLLCVSCHQRSNLLDRSLRARLAAAAGVPLAADGENARFVEDAETKKVASAARALLSVKHVLPEARRRELEAVVLQHYPEVKEVTPELLGEAASVQVVFENADYESLGGRVVEYFTEHGGLLMLEQIWREHFLASMRPRHMPPLWSVRHNEERMRIRFDEGRLSEEELKLLGLSKWITT